MPDLTDRVALVTGSTSGIGKGIAEHLASLGARVVVHGRDMAAGEALVETLKARGSEALFVRGDVGEEGVCRSLVQHAVQRFGRLDVLVNNAALTTRGAIETAPVELWDRIMAVNVRAPFILIQEAIPPMRNGGGGAIVNIGSINAYIGQDNLGPYSISKGAMMTLTRNAAAALGRHRIRVNQINVGWTLTEGEERVKREEEGLGADWLEHAIKTRPFGRLLGPLDIAYAAAYFASDESACITGSILDLEQFPIGAPGTW